MQRMRAPWARLTRAGIPKLVVVRRTLVVEGDRVLEVGDPYPAPQDRQQEKRCRQYYEAQRIGPRADSVPSPEVKKGKKNGRSKK